MTVSTLLPRPLPSPVADAYARLAGVFPALGIRELARSEQAPPGAGWVGAAALAAGGAALDTFLAWDNAQVAAGLRTPARPDVIASLRLPPLRLAGLPAGDRALVPAAAGCPGSRSPTCAFHAAPWAGWRCGCGSSPACPTTRRPPLPGARSSPDEEALRGEVRAAVAEHLGPVLDGFGPRMRRGRRALWGMATDEIVEGLWYIGQLLGEEPRAMAELDALLPGTAKPYVGTPGFRDLTGPDGRRLPTRDRASCCLFYTVRPEDTCVTCPRTCDADRVAKLSAAS